MDNHETALEAGLRYLAGDDSAWLDFIRLSEEARWRTECESKTE